MKTQEWMVAAVVPGLRLADVEVFRGEDAEAQARAYAESGRGSQYEFLVAPVVARVGFAARA